MNQRDEPSADLLQELPQDLDRAVLELALAEGEPPMAQRVFVNRTLRMDSIRYVGFDLDWTLADYHRIPLEELTFRLALDSLVKERGYGKGLANARFRPNFPRRGLLIDKKLGTVFKMNRHRYVGRAYLGRNRVSDKDRRRMYRSVPVDPGNAKRFYHVDTLFELPEANLFSEVVEHMRQGLISKRPYGQVFKDIRSTIDSVHRDGSLKTAILADLPTYLPRDVGVAVALRRMSLAERRVMLITNSEWSYTEALCSYMFDGLLPGLNSWRDLFDLVIVRSKKPAFFREQRPFVLLDKGVPKESVAVPEWGNVYDGGNRNGLMELINEPGDRVLYVGDHIYGDILASKQRSTWRSALIVRELEDEVTTRIEQRHQITLLQALRQALRDLGHRIDELEDVLRLARNKKKGEALNPELVRQARKQRDHLRRDFLAMRRRATTIQERLSAANNPHWGSLFKQGGSKSFFGAQVNDFACIYTSRVRNLAHYGSNHYFRVLTDPMNHELDPT